MSLRLEEYLKKVQLEPLFKKLGASNPKILAKTVEHFTTKEGEERDEIVEGYFGQCGIDQMVDAITRSLLAAPRLAPNAKVLDVGAGSGFFTVRVAQKIRSRLPKVAIYAMDLTPAMLVSLARKEKQITPFVGLAENIKGSIEETSSSIRIPRKFDAVFSTLMLHHSAQPEKVFESIGNVLKKKGKATIVDLCEHDFKEFKVEMGDVHLGFKPEQISDMAQNYFSTVKVKKIPGICCKSSGRSAEIFVAAMQNPT